MAGMIARTLLLVECKTSDTVLSPHLLSYQERLDVPLAVQVVLQPGHENEWQRGKAISHALP